MKTIQFLFVLLIGLTACNKENFHLEPIGVDQRLSQDLVEDAWIISGPTVAVVTDESDGISEDIACPFPELTKPLVEEVRKSLQEEATAACQTLVEDYQFCHQGTPQTIRVSAYPPRSCFE